MAACAAHDQPQRAEIRNDGGLQQVRNAENCAFEVRQAEGLMRSNESPPRRDSNRVEELATTILTGKSSCVSFTTPGSRDTQ